jgi:hypothetical protein
MFILGVVTLGSSSLTLMEPTLPLYLQTTYKVLQHCAVHSSSNPATAVLPRFVSLRLPTLFAGHDDEHRPHVCSGHFGLRFCGSSKRLAE